MTRLDAATRFPWWAWLAPGTLALALTFVLAWTPLIGPAPGLALLIAPVVWLLLTAPRRPLTWLARWMRRRDLHRHVAAMIQPSRASGHRCARPRRDSRRVRH